MAKKEKSVSEQAKARIVKYLKQNGSHIKSDTELIDLYAETYEFYQRMRSELKEAELLVQHTNKGGATNTVKNPLAVEVTKTVQVLGTLLKLLGLTPAQRKAAISGGNGKGDDFDNF